MFGNRLDRSGLSTVFEPGLLIKSHIVAKKVDGPVQALDGLSAMALLRSVNEGDIIVFIKPIAGHLQGALPLNQIPNIVVMWHHNLGVKPFNDRIDGPKADNVLGVIDRQQSNVDLP